MEIKEWFVTYVYYRKGNMGKIAVTASMFMYGGEVDSAQDTWNKVKQDDWELISIVRV